MKNKVPITVKRGQRFYLEPRDLTSDLTFANTRSTEMLHAKHQMPIPDEHIPVMIKGVEHHFYDVTGLGGDTLRTIYDTQMLGSIPIVMWHKYGKKPYQRYQPKKATQGFPFQLKKANAAVKKAAIEKLLASGLVQKAN